MHGTGLLMGTLYCKRPPRRHLVKMVEKHLSQTGEGGGGVGGDLAAIRTYSSVSSFSGESENGFLSVLSAASSSRPWLWPEGEEGGSRRGWVGFFPKQKKMSSILRSLLLGGRLSMAVMEALHPRGAGGWRAALQLLPPPSLRRRCRRSGSSLMITDGGY